MADVRRRAGVTSSDASGLGQDVVAAIGDLAQLLDGFIKAAAFGGAPHRGAMEGAVEQLILGAHTSAYRTTFRICQTRDSRIDLKIVYRDHSTQILKQVADYTIGNRWIEFRDALGKLQTVRADDVSRISRSSAEDPDPSQPPAYRYGLGVPLLSGCPRLLKGQA